MYVLVFKISEKRAWNYQELGFYTPRAKLSDYRGNENGTVKWPKSNEKYSPIVEKYIQSIVNLASTVQNNVLQYNTIKINCSLIQK